MINITVKKRWYYYVCESDILMKYRKQKKRGKIPLIYNFY